MDTGHRQIVGICCVRCGGSILMIVEAKFCPKCACPVHISCMGPNPTDLSGCSICGADAASQARHAALSARAEAEVKRDERHAISRVTFSKFAPVMAIMGVVFLIRALFALASGNLLYFVWILLVALSFGVGVLVMVRAGRKPGAPAKTISPASDGKLQG